MIYEFNKTKNTLIKNFNGKGIRPNLIELDSYVYDSLRKHSQDIMEHL